MLAEKHPDLFEKALKYETEHDDGRVYTWNEGETLLELLGRKEEVIAEHYKAMERQKKNAHNKTLAQVFHETLEEEDFHLPCLICNL